MGSTRRLGQGNTTRDSTPRSTVRLTPVSESVTPLESSVVNENSPDNRATNRFEYKLRIYCSLYKYMVFGSDVVVFHSDVRRLLREQKRLQETSSSIQAMLADIQKDTSTSTASQKRQVPRDLSVSIAIKFMILITDLIIYHV